VSAATLYATAYNQRTNDISRQGHQRIFDAFTGTKYQFGSRDEVNGFLTGLSAKRVSAPH